MTSDQEREVFEAWAWVYDPVQRHWQAPDGHVVTTDSLMTARDVMGPAMEAQLRDIIAEHGTRPSASS